MEESRRQATSTLLMAHAKFVLANITGMDFVAAMAMFIVATTELHGLYKREFKAMLDGAMRTTVCTDSLRQRMGEMLKKVVREEMTKRADQVVKQAAKFEKLNKK
jgi:histidinol-phosphate/aromatic aminotransferase/cobyric acid decarboxylase-like protein